MTVLTGSKSVTRETRALYRGKPMVVTVDPYFVTVRVKGKRYRYEVPIEAIFHLAAKKEAAKIAAEKKSRKKNKTK